MHLDGFLRQLIENPTFVPIVVNIKSNHPATGTLINRDRIKLQLKRLARMNLAHNKQATHTGIFQCHISRPVKVRGFKDHTKT